MKKLLRLLILLFVFVPIIGQAKTYEIDKYISIDFDNDWYVFTRNNYIGNAELTALGISEEQMLSIFESNNIYVDAINKKDVGKSFYSEFFVRRLAISTTKDMKDYTETDLKDFGDAFVTSLPTDEYEVYKNSNNTYLRINFVDTLEGKTIYMEEYVTVYKGYAYSFGLQTTERVLTESDKTLVKDKVDNLVYLNAGNTKEETKKEESKEEKEEKESKENKLSTLDYAVIALVIICLTVIIVTLIVTIGNKKKVKI